MSLLCFVSLVCIVHMTVGDIPPVITCPDATFIVIPAGQSLGILKWKDPSATDTEDGPLTPQPDKESPTKGSSKPAGSYVIKYLATDKQGQRDACSFYVYVQAAHCPAIAIVQKGRSSCRDGTASGGTCTLICDPGYEVVGSASITCQANSQYSGGFGTCQEIDYYKRICRDLVSAPSSHFVRDIDTHFQKMLTRFQDKAVLSSHSPLQRAETRCRRPGTSGQPVCVFLARFNLFEKLKKDIRLFTVHPSGSDDAVSNWHLFTYRRILLLHPKIEEFCVQETELNKHLIYFPDIERENNEDYQNYLRKTMEALGKTNTVDLRAEATEVCNLANRKGKDCILQSIFALVDRAELFLTYLDRAGSWRNVDVRHYFRGLTLNSVILKWIYKERLDAVKPNTSLSQQKVITEIVGGIYLYIDEGQDEKLRMLMSMFPEYSTDKICNSGTWCLFWRVVDQSRVYLIARQPRNKKGKEVLFLNSDMDYRDFLSQKQMERVLQLTNDKQFNLIKIAEELKKEFRKTINKRFSELKTYFKKVHSFSAAKAKADMVVADYIKDINKKSVPLAKEIDKNIVLIISAMSASTALEVKGKLDKLVVIIAENCNPLKAISDSGGVSKIWGAVAELANAVATIAKAGRLLAAIFTLRDRASDLAEGFKKNEDLILAMKTIMESINHKNQSSDQFKAAKDLFLKKYTDYYPAVTRAEVVEMQAYFENVVQEACSIIEGTETAHAAISKSIVGRTGLCWLTKIKIAKLIQMYASLYDYQFELIEVIATNVQSQVALEAADGIVADYDAIAESNKDEDNVFERIKQVAGLSFVSYRIMVIQVVRMYCDELQYKAGGVRPALCQDASTNIGLLLSHVESPCTSTGFQFQSVSNRPQKKGDTAFMSLKDLYAGNEISFKIENSRWLNLAGWISKADQNSVFYVSGFEVYLPSELKYRREVRVQVIAEGDNELVPGGTRYRILPTRHMVFEYRVGHGLACRQAPLHNPYTTCSNNSLPDICPKTFYECDIEGGRRVLNPSIYSHFRIRVNGYEKTPVPKPVTILPIKVAVKLCKYTPSGAQGVRDSGRWKQRTSPKCCSSGQYWSGKKQACQECPGLSRVALRGYYCERP